MNLTRALIIRADGTRVATVCRSWLHGTDTLSLFPDCFLLDLWNLTPDTVSRLRSGIRLAVSLAPDSSAGIETLLASGEIGEVFTRPAPDGSITTVTFSPGLSFWESAVSLTVPGGVSVSETVRQLLANSGTGIPLSGFSGPDPVFSRAQSFHGRTADAIEAVVSACGGHPLLTSAGLVILPAEDTEDETLEARRNVMIIPASHLLSDPVPLRSGWICRLWPSGIQPGTCIRIGSTAAAGLVTRRLIDADSGEGSWYEEIEVE